MAHIFPTLDPYPEIRISSMDVMLPFPPEKNHSLACSVQMKRDTSSPKIGGKIVFVNGFEKRSSKYSPKQCHRHPSAIHGSRGVTKADRRKHTLFRFWCPIKWNSSCYSLVQVKYVLSHMTLLDGLQIRSWYTAKVCCPPRKASPCLSDRQFPNWASQEYISVICPIPTGEVSLHACPRGQQ